MTPAFLTDELAAIKAEAEQMIRDALWWNANRPEEQPLDCESERVIVFMAGKGLRAAAAGDHAAFSRIVSEVAAYAVKTASE